MSSRPQSLPAHYWLLSLWLLTGLAQAAPFTVIDIAERSLDGAPALGVVFNRPLDAKINQDQHFAVTDGDGLDIRGAWVLADNGRVIYFPHINPETQYRVRVKTSLVAATGEPLSKPAETEVTTRKVVPAASFASQGLILPREIARGLPVVSVNTPEVDIEFLRVPPEKVADFLRENSRSTKTSIYQLDQMRAWSQLVYQGRFQLSQGRNKRVTTLIPVLENPRLRQPGLYVAVMRTPGRYEYSLTTSYFVISDIGLMTRRYAHGMMAFANSLATTRPLAGVSLELFDDKAEPMDRVSTDSEGKARITRGRTAQTLVARLGDDIAILELNRPALDLSEFPIDGRVQQRREIFVYGPRDLYRPGEAVPISALLRDQDGQAIQDQPLHARLLRPDGREMAKFVWQPRQLGYFHREIHLPKAAQSGLWNLELRLDPSAQQATASHEILVEEFLPERMELRLSSEQTSIAAGHPLQVQVQGDYLYGAPASGNRLETVARWARDRHPLERYKDYYFGDVDDGLQPGRHHLEDMPLDDEGRAELEFTVPERAPKSPIKLALISSLYESGGRPVTRSIQRTIWPAPALVGIRPLFQGQTAEPDSRVAFEVVRVDESGRLLPSKLLLATLYREDRDYYWVHSDSEGWQAKFTATDYPVAERDVRVLIDTRGRFDMHVERGSYRLEVNDPETGLTAKYRFNAGWSWEDEDDLHGGVRPDQVSMTLDQAAYSPGDVAKITLTSPHAGSALLLVESDRMLMSRRFEIGAEPKQVEIPIALGWRGHDIYLSATVLRPAAKEARITPNRAVGLLHLPLDRSDRNIELTLDLPEEMRPEQDLIAKIQAPGRAAQETLLTLAAVDVGVLNITDFKTPDPFGFFFAKRRFGADLHDLYGQVIEAFDGQLGKLKFGGDLALGAGGKKPDPKVKILSLFQQPVTLDDQGKAEIRLSIPDFNGRVRVMALAFSADSYGQADGEFTIAAPVIAEISTPRFMAPGDRGRLTLDLHNKFETAETIAFELSADSPLLLGPIQQSLDFQPDERRTLNFPMIGAEAFGVGDIRLSLQAADYATERHWQLGVRPPWPAETRGQRRRLNPGESLAPESEQLIGGLLPSTLQGRIEASNNPPLDLAGRLKSLLGYPYGCLEQTTSKAYPAIFADANTQQRLGLEPIDQAKRLEWVESGIERLRGLQLSNGGFGLWNDSSPEEPWLTPYVVDFLLDAKAQGYPVPADMLQRSLKRLKRRLRGGEIATNRYSQNQQHLSFAAQAYAGYVLSRVNQAPLGSLRTLYDDRAKDAATGLPLAHIGLALRNQGDQRRAAEALNKAVQMPVNDDYLGDYGSPIRDLALMIHLLAALPDQADKLEPLLYQLDFQLNERRWLSTQEQVALFLAGRDLTGQAGPGWKAEWRIGESSMRLQTLGSWRATLGDSALQQPLMLTNTGDRPIYTSLTINGYGKQAPKPVESGLAITRLWYDTSGERIEPATIKAGDLAVVRLQIASEHAIEHGLVVDLLPAGLEIENANLSKGEAVGDFGIGDTGIADLQSPVRHQEFREDRYVAALELPENHSADLFYLVRAVTPGEYRVPPPFVEDMYRPSLRAIGEVVEQMTIAE